MVDAVSEVEVAAPRPVLDNEYEIRPCRPDPDEDPARNKAEAERDARLEPLLDSSSLVVPANAAIHSHRNHRQRLSRR